MAPTYWSPFTARRIRMRVHFLQKQGVTRLDVVAAGARTTRCWSARPASARPPSPRAWR